MFKIVFYALIGITITACQLEVPAEINSDRFEIPIADKNLAQAINLQLGKSQDSPLYWEDIAVLKKLDATGREITELTGLQYFTSLSRLKLADNQLNNLEQLALLTNLDTLDLSNNQIVDLSPLAQLSKLKRLQLSNNRIYSVSALQNLLNLHELYLDYNKIDLITALKQNCVLNGLGVGDYVNLKFNRLDSIRCIADLNYIKNQQVVVEHDSLKNAK